MSQLAGQTDNGGITQSGLARSLSWLILAFAAFLRFYDLSLISVTNATAFQELTAGTALSVSLSEWPLAGPPTEELRSSSFLITVVAIARLVQSHPFAGVVCVAALNLAAVALLFRCCHRQFGVVVAGVAAALYASAPWSVLYSRCTLPASCLSFFSVWLLHVSMKWLSEGRPHQLFGIVLLAIVLPQIHFSALFAPLWLIAVLWCGKKELNVRAIALGACLGVVFWLPWLHFHNVTEWRELSTWAEGIFQTPGEHFQALGHSIVHLQTMLHAGGTSYWFGETAVAFPFPVKVACRGAAILLTGLLLVSATGIRKWRVEPRQSLLLAWVLLAIVVGGVLRTGTEPANLLVAFPVPFILIGLVAGRLWNSVPVRFRHVPLVLVAAIGLLHAGVLWECARAVASGRNSPQAAYGNSYAQRREAVREIQDDAAGLPVQIAGSFSGWYPAYDFVLVFELDSAEMDQRKTGHAVYWVDEIEPEIGVRPQQHLIQKERKINAMLAEYFRTPPDWTIERHWSTGTTQIYRVRFTRKEPLK